MVMLKRTRRLAGPKAGRERMDRTVDALKDLDIQQLFPAYCTGRDLVERLQHEFPQRRFFFACTVLNLEG